MSSLESEEYSCEVCPACTLIQLRVWGISFVRSISQRYEFISFNFRRN